MAQPINPWKVAIDGWLDRVGEEIPSASFRDAWMRLSTLSTADLELKPLDLGTQGTWLMLGLEMHSFGKPVGRFECALRDQMKGEDRTLFFASPAFSATINDDLRQATLACLYKLAPAKSELAVVIEDDLVSPVSTLSVAGQYTEAGWGLNPKDTELISETPRKWIFRFSKNSYGQ